MAEANHDDPLVRLGGGNHAKEGAESAAPSAPQPSGEASPAAERPDPPLPRWASTLWLVGCLALAQWMLLVAWSGAQIGVDDSLRCDYCEQVFLAPIAAAVGTLFAAFAARQCGAGRIGQLVLALAVIGSPQIAWLASHVESFLPLVGPLALWSQLRALRTRTVAAASLSAFCAVLLYFSSPSAWVTACAIVASLAFSGLRPFVASLAVALAVGGVGLLSFPVDFALSSSAGGADWLWTSPLSLGLACIALALVAAMRLRSLSSWLRPFLASMVAALAIALLLDPRAEVLWTPLLGLAALGAGWIGAQVEVRGRGAMACLLAAAFVAGVALIPVFIGRLGAG